jgi:S-adenosylmethionine:diacylglycerol 3-amino-3-carboxypropyl transferase
MQLSTEQNDELGQIYLMAKYCTTCYFAGPVFLTRARNDMEAAYNAMCTQSQADYEAVRNAYNYVARDDYGYRLNADSSTGE